MTILKSIPLVSTTSIGLDIGTDSIKSIKLRRKGASYELLSYGVVPVSDLKSRPPEEQSAKISDVLRELLKGEKGVVDIFTAVSGSEVITKNFVLPNMRKAEFGKAVLWASKKHLPIPLEDAYFDYKILGEVEDQEIIKKEVMIVAATKRLINDRIGIFDKSGLKVAGISVTPFAFRNLLGLIKTGPPSIAWIDIGAKFTTIAIFQDHVLRFSREILTAGDSITESTRLSAFTLDEEVFPDEGAERSKKEYGVSKQDVRPEIASSTIPVIDRLIGEIERSFSFHQQRHPGSSIEQVYLTGGTARLKGLPQMMQERLGIDVKIINPFENIKIGLSPMETAKLIELAPIFSVATGLALETGEGINLVPSEIKEQRAMARLMPVLRISAMSLILILSFLYWYATAQVKANKESLNVWQNSIQTLKATALAPLQIKEKTDRIKIMKETIARLEEGERTEPFILKEIANILPQSIALKSLSIAYHEESDIEEKGEQKKASVEQEPARKAMRFQIEGTVCGEETSLEVDLARFMIALNSSAFLKNPRLLSQERNVLNERNVLEFGLSCELQ